MKQLVYDINYNFRIFFQPGHYKDPKKHKTIPIGAGQVEGYIGKENAQRVFKQVLASETDKTIIKLRNYGKLSFYVK